MKRMSIPKGMVVALVIGSLPCCLWSNNEQQEKTTTKQNQSKGVMQPVELPSGLKYVILKKAAADAKSPRQGSPVTVHYTGWLEDANKPGSPDESKKFDSSLDRGMPFQFALGMGRVIKGWDEGVALMKVGEIRRLIIPADLGYGARGAGGAIPPNATLVFDVTLLGVE